MSPRGAFWIALLFLGACAGGAVRPVGSPIPGSPGVREAAAGQGMEGARVRWGGTILGIENRADATWVEVLARDLSEEGRPAEEGRSEGRFIASVAGFLDPALYSSGRAFSVTGVIAGFETRMVGGFAYRYPIVKAERHALWELRREYEGYYRDPFYDPFYDPWHPFFSPYYPWPYRYRWWPY